MTARETAAVIIISATVMIWKGLLLLLAVPCEIVLWIYSRFQNHLR